jgi:mercuric ion transport protein
MGTLLCCALPSLFVLFGFGATIASVLSAAPWLVTLSQQKSWIFGASAILIVGNFYYVYRIVPRLLVERGTCPADDPRACARAARVSRVMPWCSALILASGLSVAYLLPMLLRRLDS